jgi:hypothetical protein
LFRALRTVLYYHGMGVMITIRNGSIERRTLCDL